MGRSAIQSATEGNQKSSLLGGVFERKLGWSSVLLCGLILSRFRVR